MSVRRASFVIIFVCCLLIGSLLRVGAILNTDITEALGHPLVDDSFYYFSLGRNWAAGNGPRVDASHLTTGFQPLWGWLSPIPYLLFPHSDSAAIATFQVMGSLVGLATALLIYWLTIRLTKSRWIALITMSLWWLAPQVVADNVSGMETSLAVLSVVAILLALQSVLEQPTRKRIMLTGLVCGLAFLCRVDTLILTGLVALVIALNLPQRNFSAIAKRISWFAVCMGVAILPWCLFVFSLGKPFMPESGDAVRLSSASIYLEVPKGTFELNQVIYTNQHNLANLNLFLVSFLQYFAKTIYVLNPLRWLTIGMSEQIEIVATSLGLALSIFIFMGVILNRRERIFRITTITTLLYAGGMVFIYAYYIFAVWFFGRYATPVGECFSILLTIIVLYRAMLAKKPTTRRISLALCAMWIGLTGASYLGMYVNHPDYSWITQGSDGSFNNSTYSVVEWVKENIKSEPNIGAFQSGLFGYYTPNVYNLDGKVNQDAFLALRHGDVWEYLCRANIPYVVDWAFTIDALMKNRSTTWADSNLTLLYSSAYPPNMETVRTNVYRVNCATSAKN